MALKLTLTGFDDYLLDLKKAGANVEKIATEALEKSGNILFDALNESVRNSGLSEETINEMNKSLKKPTIYKNELGGKVSSVVCELGFKKGRYDPRNPSGGYIAIFNEFGTDERQTEAGAYRGSLEELSFTRRAIKKTSAKIKRTQKNIIQKGLQEALNV